VDIGDNLPFRATRMVALDSVKARFSAPLDRPAKKKYLELP